ncbi:MAG: hypothetical protein C4326_07235 [Ignavibacteria bacterium]
MAVVLGQLWALVAKTRLHYALMYFVLVCLIARVVYPTLAHSEIKEEALKFSSQVATLDSLAQQAKLLFDVSDLDLRFFWQVCWASPAIERNSEAPAQQGGKGPAFLSS